MGIIDNTRSKMLGSISTTPKQSTRPVMGLAEQYNVPETLTLDDQLKAGIITPEAYREALLYNNTKPLGGLR